MSHRRSPSKSNFTIEDFSIRNDPKAIPLSIVTSLRFPIPVVVSIDEFSPERKENVRCHLLFLLLLRLLLPLPRSSFNSWSSSRADFLQAWQSGTVMFFIFGIIDIFQVVKGADTDQPHTRTWNKYVYTYDRTRQSCARPDGSSEKRWNFVRACNAWLLKPPNPRVHTCLCTTGRRKCTRGCTGCCTDCSTKPRATVATRTGSKVESLTDADRQAKLIKRD